MKIDDVTLAEAKKALAALERFVGQNRRYARHRPRRKVDPEPRVTIDKISMVWCLERVHLMSTWEVGFIENVKGRELLTDRQNRKFHEIIARLKTRENTPTTAEPQDAPRADELTETGEVKHEHRQGKTVSHRGFALKSGGRHLLAMNEMARAGKTIFETRDFVPYLSEKDCNQTSSILGQGCTLGIIFSTKVGKGRSRLWHYTNEARDLVRKNGLIPYTKNRLEVPEYLRLKNQPDIAPGEFQPWRRKVQLVMWALWKMKNKPSRLEDLRIFFDVDTPGLLDLFEINTTSNLAAHLCCEANPDRVKGVPFILHQKDIFDVYKNKYWLSPAGLKFIEERGNSVWTTAGKQVPSIPKKRRDGSAPVKATNKQI